MMLFDSNLQEPMYFLFAKYDLKVAISAKRKVHEVQMDTFSPQSVKQTCISR